MNKFLNISFKINNNSFILAIKNCFLSIMPLIIINSFLVLMINLLGYFHIKNTLFDYEKILFNISISIENIIPYIFIFLFTQNIFRIKHEKHKLQLSIFSIVALLLYSIFIIDNPYIIRDSMILRAIVIGILNYFLYNLISKIYTRYIHINILKSFYFVEDICLGLIHLVILSTLYFLIFKFFPNLRLDLSTNLHFNNSLRSPLIYNLILLLPWFFGINGAQLMKASYVELYQNASFNMTSFAHSKGYIKYFDESFYNLYINIGGSGATFCLLLALLIHRKNEYKNFSKLAFIPSLFNVNEIVVYGFPIVGNVLLMIPFILVPTLFTILTYFALLFKFIQPATIYTSWLTPTIISGFTSSQGNYRVVIWQIFLIIIGTLIYLFFLKKFMKIDDKIALQDISSINETISDYGSHFDYIVDFNEAKHKLNLLLKKGNLTLYFQPIVNIVDNKIIKMESLVRINHEELGIVSPYFISYFKTLNKMPDLDYWVIEESFKYGKILENKGKNYCLSINISAETFMQKNFYESIIELVNKYSVNPRKFNLEIVEEVCLLDIKSVKFRINELKEFGFTIAIDDFGTGYSSLSYLLDLEVNYIKIDRQFVINLKLIKGEIVLKNIIQLCKSIGYKVIVEGVETEIELSILKKLGVDMIQGYYYFKPNSFENIQKEIDEFDTKNLKIIK